jgi:hypothetical protein
MTPRAASAVVAVVLVAGWPLAARAQDTGEEDARASFLLGGGLGLGGMSFSVDGEEAVSYDNATGFQLAFGGMITPRLALGIDLTMLMASDDNLGEELRVFERAIGAWVRFWVIPRLWLQAGLASVRAGASSDFEDLPTYDGAQLHGAVGFELLHRTHWAIDVSLRLATAGYGDESDVGGSFSSTSAALLVGFAWFH